MLQQAVDLREEGDELYALLETLDPADWVRNTPFKSWTADDDGSPALRRPLGRLVTERVHRGAPTRQQKLGGR